MKKTLMVFIVFNFLILLIIPSLQAETFSSASNIKIYVDNLLESYNSIIYMNEWKKPDFSERQKFFYLFHEPDISFNVTCVSSDVDGVIALIFKQVPVYQEKIYLDFQHKIQYYYTGYEGFGEDGYMTGNFAESGGSMRYMFYAFSMRQDDISNNTNVTIYKSGQRASWLYNKDKNSIEQYKINLIWKPFEENYSEVINNYNYNLIWRKIDFQNQISSDGYTYESFLIDFPKFNKTVQHYKFKPVMEKELTDYFNQTSNLTYPILIWNFKYELSKNFITKHIEMKDNISINESYLYTNFQDDIQVLKTEIINIQADKQKQIDFYFHLTVAIMLTIIISIYYYLVEKRTTYNKVPEQIKISLGDFKSSLYPIPIYVLYFSFESQVDWSIKIIPLLPIIIYILYKSLKNRKPKDEKTKK